MHGTGCLWTSGLQIPPRELTVSVAIPGLMLPSSACCRACLLGASGCILVIWTPHPFFLGPVSFLAFSFPSSLGWEEVDLVKLSSKFSGLCALGF